MKHGWGSPSPSPGSRYLLAGLLATTVLVGLLSISVVGVDRLLAANAPPAAPVGGGIDSLSPAVLSNTTPCGLFAAEYPPASLPEYYANYSIMFSKVCETPEFVSLYENLTPRTGFFIVGAGGHIGEPPILSLAIDYVANCTNASLGPPTSHCVFTTGWLGYLSNNSVVGPFTQEYPLISMGPPPPVTASSTSAWSSWLLPALVGVVVAAGVLLMVVSSRRRTALREAVLFDPPTPPADRSPGSTPKAPPSLSNAPPSPPSGTESAERTDTLDDVF